MMKLSEIVKPIGKKECTKVKNMKCTSELECKCGSWLKHWKNYKESVLESSKLECANKKCDKPAENGGHVERSDNGDECIVPLCGKCNNSKFTEAYCVPEEYLVTAACDRE